MAEETAELPEPGEWYKRTVVRVGKDHQVFRRSTYWQCMKIGGVFNMTQKHVTNPNSQIRVRRRGRMVKLKTIIISVDPPIKARSLIFRTPKNLRRASGIVWKNLHVYSDDFPVYNNPNPTPQDPTTFIIFTKEEPKKTRHS